jgi:hypothetical protein
MGLKHGRLLDKKIIPKIEPVRSFKKYIEDKKIKDKENDELEGWFGKQGIMNYNPYDVKDGEK